ncbi:hypothetical protein M2152_001664 [Microbacteriaceae bacterium SG_E_30_P1]|uniref:DUF3515 family protein n=1 Tax=Antiquaquibacter oligotrophicus TaxID=2880260 RepID=A0ABT6KQV0_9MICO|nr:DUF3515 family protein [Antiquaquibacter oligotrophicus]MDH6181482.1 hypothetical protein [Antiquaquibacter oligotrophicus]UDF12828.1 DUF3515 domain-containing protein [Antiquaquibacter oligotrophicus]
MRLLLPLGALVLLLAGCAPTVALEPAADAADPLCAEVSVRLPDSVDDLTARETNAQATGAWGEPTAVIVRCGVPSPAPTAELPCVTVEGIDWLRDDTDAPDYVFTSYGREPAVEVIVDSEVASGLDVLTALAPAVGRLPASGECVALEDAG